jgi:arylsulfatase A-like enzyme
MDLLKNDQADFIFLHIPIPHSPNIWNRRTGTYAQRCGRSYLDSLALADRELGRILAVLKQSPRWKDTTLIVEGDHSWRIMLWDNQPAWTKEDERASRGVFDPRPALIIHAAGQQTPQTDSRAMPLLYVHRAIERVLRGGDARP